MKKLYLFAGVSFALCLTFSCSECRTNGCHQDMTQAAGYVNAASTGPVSYYSNSFHLSAPSRELACRQLGTLEKNYGPTCRVEWK